ncbi:hypothetical protein HDA32_000512 [Spinactinospora alkalitolerans]|uniref:Uncharacterized protein n=1 Tax=Spinactinospora alkalitolerans TaxID=687207 RepID=A0A852TRC8_9ACTN|nr:hypothetical protein [Spinactinospora alkalitolerans]NYE45392.1 hypothetical protein [Spinactinospora alkalitolerans]
MTELALLVTSITVTGLIVIISIIQVSRVRQARIHGGRQEEYRALAEEAAEAQRSAAARTAELTDTVKRLEDRIAALEKLLRDVG